MSSSVHIDKEFMPKLVVESEEKEIVMLINIDYELLQAINTGLSHFIKDYGRTKNYKSMTDKAQNLHDQILSYIMGEDVTSKVIE